MGILFCHHLKLYNQKYEHIYLSNPSTRAGCDTRSIFQPSFASLNLESSFSLTGCLFKAKKPSLLYYLLITGETINGFLTFLRALVLYEIQSASSISEGNNHYKNMNTSSSSSSCRAASADIPDPLSPFLPIIHRLRQVFRVTSCVLT